jgi:hypothetical protein
MMRKRTRRIRSMILPVAIMIVRMVAAMKKQIVITFKSKSTKHTANSTISFVQQFPLRKL